MNNVFAYTDPGNWPYPQYISINERAPGVFSIDVRSAGTNDGRTSSIGLTAAQMLALADAITKKVTP